MAALQLQPRRLLPLGHHHEIDPVGERRTGIDCLIIEDISVKDRVRGFKALVYLFPALNIPRGAGPVNERCCQRFGQIAVGQPYAHGIAVENDVFWGRIDILVKRHLDIERLVRAFRVRTEIACPAHQLRGVLSVDVFVNPDLDASTRLNREILAADRDPDIADITGAPIHRSKGVVRRNRCRNLFHLSDHSIGSHVSFHPDVEDQRRDAAPRLRPCDAAGINAFAGAAFADVVVPRHGVFPFAIEFLNRTFSWNVEDHPHTVRNHLLETDLRLNPVDARGNRGVDRQVEPDRVRSRGDKIRAAAAAARRIFALETDEQRLSGSRRLNPP